MMNIQNNKGVWIGLAHVKPNTGNASLQGAIGAFVPSLALANDADEYAGKVTSLLEEYDFEVLELEDIEPFEMRKKHTDVSIDVEKLASEINSDNPVLLDEFQAYDSLERNPWGHANSHYRTKDA